ncbi:VCBS repeat-containing protein [Spirosoma spitsbergense]|uniref:VCBS repeat-containing protein n=1 Tax=Spirosoma spitsbergense TaxID=431554 RepID=UPI0003667ADC|nr:VCBS repeat-containing protein [Spirosoma spitsbergense]
MKYVTAVWFICSLMACSHTSDTLFTTLSPAESGVDFQNTIAENDTVNLVDYYYVYNGGGVAVGDINNDDLPDLYFTGNQVGDRLYLNITKPGSEHPQFKDITQTSGIRKAGWSTGVTMADVNADGLLDIYVCKSGNYPGNRRKNQLYINKGSAAGESPHFAEQADQYGLADTTYTNQAAFLDYDHDGDLDVYLLTSTNLIRNPNQVTPVIADGSGLASDKLFRNDSDASGPHFTDVTKAAGILHDGMGLGLTVADFNQDGWDDIYVANDFLANDFLYLNNRSTRPGESAFSEVGKTYFKHHSQFSMGCDAADINNDGLTDLVVADMLPADNEQRKKMAGPANYQQFESITRQGYHPQFMRNMLQVNGGKAPDGRMVFSEIGQLAGVSATDWSWSPLLADLDNDGWRDLFITNGYLRDITDLDFVSFNNNVAQEGSRTPDEVNRYLRQGATKMPSINKPNRFFRNRHDLTFDDVTASWFGTESSLSNGASYADLDRDGDLDLVVNNINQPAFILQNNTANTHYVQLKLRGPAQNLFGLGADVTVYSRGLTQTYHQAVTRGYQSSGDYIIHVGLGSASQLDSVRVVWPDGKAQTLTNPPINQLLTLEHGQARTIPARPQPAPSTLLTDVTEASGLNFTHQEEPYLDYNQEPLLPHKLSQQGPKLTAGDVNGDGLEDLFVGGSFRHYGKLLLQTSAGRFIEKAYTDESQPKDEEDVGALLFDADGDGDKDLYIVSGSNEYYDGSVYYQDRLYLNNGSGTFTNATDHLPPIRHSGSCIVAADIDHDGDLDLFRGGRLRALQYPLSGESSLLINEGGRFREATDALAPGLKSAGMVTDAIWADIDRDSWPDLIVVGEMMPITIFRNNKGHLEHLESQSLAGSDGFWNCIRAGDFDNDGDPDFVLGNLGLNSRYRVSPTQPMRVYAGDFDGNGRLDAISTYYLQDQEYPIASRDELGRQWPGIKKQFTSYALYAKARLTDLLSPEQQKASTRLRACVQQSILLENTGNGTFRLKPLPMLAQWAPIQDFLVDDIDRDGNLDVLAVGNAYDTESIAGQYDAMTGLLLRGDGRGKFQPLLFSKSGFLADGDCKSIVRLTSKAQPIYVVSANKAPLRVFQSQNQKSTALP